MNFVFLPVFCYTYDNCFFNFPFVFICMGNAFIPQGSSPTLSSEQETKDLFDLDETREMEQSVQPPEPESAFQPEKEPQTVDTSIEKNSSPQTAEKLQKKQPPRAAYPHPANAYTPPDPLAFQIEKIMEEGIAEAYQELTPVQKQQFKIKGEQTALQIKALLQSTRVKVKKIFRLLLEWLKLLPGVNRFFLMQEAKIKTDKIIALKDNKK